MSTEDEQVRQWKLSKKIGIIGLGDMGLLYLQKFSEEGWKVCGCDREELFEEIKDKYKDEKFEVFPNGHHVSRCSDYIIYSVELESIGQIVKLYGPSTKMGSIVGGQTSCKDPEIKAFEQYMPLDVEIISVHSLHGPRVNATGQPLVLIKHRASDESFRFVQSLLSCLKSKQVILTAKEHDKITADTQLLTHAAFLSMGVAWSSVSEYPWQNSKWVGGIENAKINISLRIYSNKWHVYAGLAITNPSAHEQILQYATSVTELFTLMIQGRKSELRERILQAKQNVFGHLQEDHELLLDDDLLQHFSLSKVPPEGKQPNSHLSLLGIVDSWSKMGIVPYDHMICSTPLFRIFLGVTEYLFCTPNLLEECLEVAVDNSIFRQDDLEFTILARQWSNIVEFGDYNLYKLEFEKTQKFFAPMFPEANRLGNEMIKTIFQRVKDRESK